MSDNEDSQFELKPKARKNTNTKQDNNDDDDPPKSKKNPSKGTKSNGDEEYKPKLKKSTTHHISDDSPSNLKRAKKYQPADDDEEDDVEDPSNKKAKKHNDEEDPEIYKTNTKKPFKRNNHVEEDTEEHISKYYKKTKKENRSNDEEEGEEEEGEKNKSTSKHSKEPVYDDDIDNTDNPRKRLLALDKIREKAQQADNIQANDPDAIASQHPNGGKKFQPKDFSHKKSVDEDAGLDETGMSEEDLERKEQLEIVVDLDIINTLCDSHLVLSSSKFPLKDIQTEIKIYGSTSKKQGKGHIGLYIAEQRKHNRFLLHFTTPPCVVATAVTGYSGSTGMNLSYTEEWDQEKKNNRFEALQIISVWNLPYLDSNKTKDGYDAYAEVCRAKCIQIEDKIIQEIIANDNVWFEEEKEKIWRNYWVKELKKDVSTLVPSYSAMTSAKMKAAYAEVLSKELREEGYFVGFWNLATPKKTGNKDKQPVTEHSGPKPYYFNATKNLYQKANPKHRPDNKSIVMSHELLRKDYQEQNMEYMKLDIFNTEMELMPIEFEILPFDLVQVVVSVYTNPYSPKKNQFLVKKNLVSIIIVQRASRITVSEYLNTNLKKVRTSFSTQSKKKQNLLTDGEMNSNALMKIEKKPHIQELPSDDDSTSKSGQPTHISEPNLEENDDVGSSNHRKTYKKRHENDDDDDEAYRRKKSKMNDTQ